MSVVGIVVVAIAGWTALSVLTALAMQPLFRMARRGDLAVRAGMDRRPGFPAR